jgi:hypothetical protein
MVDVVGELKYFYGAYGMHIGAYFSIAGIVSFNFLYSKSRKRSLLRSDNSFARKNRSSDISIQPVAINAATDKYYYYKYLVGHMEKNVSVRSDKTYQVHI